MKKNRYKQDETYKQQETITKINKSERREKAIQDLLDRLNDSKYGNLTGFTNLRVQRGRPNNKKTDRPISRDQQFLDLKKLYKDKDGKNKKKDKDL